MEAESEKAVHFGGPATARSVTDYLESDHRRLDALFADVERNLAAGTIADSLAAFRSFEAGLDAHIQREDRVLFPAFEELTGFIQGPTRVLRAEHLELRRLMEEIGDALADGRAIDVERYAEEFKWTLAQHNQKEEGILYPEADEALGAAGREALVGPNGSSPSQPVRGPERAAR